jgi:hypothetical protein
MSLAHEGPVPRIEVTCGPSDLEDGCSPCDSAFPTTRSGGQGNRNLASFRPRWWWRFLRLGHEVSEVRPQCPVLLVHSAACGQLGSAQAPATVK